MPAAHSINSNDSVGSILRESRESQGITLDEAARVTRIGKNYLVALEADRYDILPNTAYAKGFLRAYAGFLGLSGNEIVGRYEKSLSPSMRPPEEEQKPSGEGAGSGARRGRWWVSLVLLALVVATAYLYDHFGSESQVPVPQVHAPALPKPPPVMSVQSSARQPQEKPAAVPVEKEKGVSPPAESPTPPEGIVLKLKVNQDCWLNITIDNATSQQYNLKPGDLIEWKGEKSFALDLGNPGGVEAEFNGKPLKQLGETGKPAHITLRAPGA